MLNFDNAHPQPAADVAALEYKLWFSLADTRKQLKASFPPQSPEAAVAARSAEFGLRLY